MRNGSSLSQLGIILATNKNNASIECNTNLNCCNLNPKIWSYNHPPTTTKNSTPSPYNTHVIDLALTKADAACLWVATQPPSFHPPAATHIQLLVPFTSAQPTTRAIRLPLPMAGIVYTCAAMMMMIMMMTVVRWHRSVYVTRFFVSPSDDSVRLCEGVYLCNASTSRQGQGYILRLALTIMLYWCVS